jgi:hypothetical protein
VAFATNDVSFEAMQKKRKLTAESYVIIIIIIIIIIIKELRTFWHC